MKGVGIWHVVAFAAGAFIGYTICKKGMPMVEKTVVIEPGALKKVADDASELNAAGKLPAGCDPKSPVYVDKDGNKYCRQRSGNLLML